MTARKGRKKKVRYDVCVEDFMLKYKLQRQFVRRKFKNLSFVSMCWFALCEFSFFENAYEISFVESTVK